MKTLCFQNRCLVVGDPISEETLGMAERAAKTDAPVLLCGESGTGKELIARYVHEHSSRASRPFVSINCAAIPEGLMEAELFGYERGAFTGALNQRIGKFEKAAGGTLLLDEVSEMSTALQAKLLRVIQESEIDRLGGKDPIAVDTRIIATTNRDPVQLVREGSFRSDLYYRLNVIRIDCAPLKGRVQAIDRISSFYLAQFGAKYERPGLTFSKDAKEKLFAHAWPGNIRELANAIERAVVGSDGANLTASNLSFLEAAEIPVPSQGGLAELEESHILKVVDSMNGNRTEAAKRLGISVRTLRNKLKQYQAGE